MISLNENSYNFLFIPPSLQRDRFPKFWVKNKNWSADRLWYLRVLLKFVIVIYRLLWIAHMPNKCFWVQLMMWNSVSDLKYLQTSGKYFRQIIMLCLEPKWFNPWKCWVSWTFILDYEIDLYSVTRRGIIWDGIYNEM